MRAALLVLALATTPALAADAVGGVRIAPLGADTGIRLGSAFVVGEYGGTTATTLQARYAHGDKLSFALGLPFVAYRLPGDQGRTIDLGNVLLEGWYLLDDGSDGGRTRGVGVEAHLNLGSRAYTWVNEPTALWPGTGIDLVYQVRTSGDLAVMYRGSVGVHGASGYEPFPRTYLRLGAAAGVDYAFDDRFGLTAEGAFTYWDPSPLEAAAVFRADPLEFLRVRAGLVLPLAVWVGATPADVEAGIREATLLLDVQMTM